MPFVTLIKRSSMLAWGHKPVDPGDYCFLAYKWLMDEWRKETRWTTADRLFGCVTVKSALYLLTFQWQKFRALQLAWQVFFHIHVMQYEFTKRKENGDI